MNSKYKTAAFVALGSVLLSLVSLGLIRESEEEFERGKAMRLPKEYRSVSPLKGLKDFFSSRPRLFSAAPGGEGTELVHTRVQKGSLEVEIVRMDDEQMQKSPALTALSRESLGESRVYSFTLRAIDDCIPVDLSNDPRKHVFLNDREGRRIDPLVVPQLESYSRIIYKKKICGSSSAPVYLQYYAAYPRQRTPVSFSLQEMKDKTTRGRSAG